MSINEFNRVYTKINIITSELLITCKHGTLVRKVKIGLKVCWEKLKFHLKNLTFINGGLCNSFKRSLTTQIIIKKNRADSTVLITKMVLIISKQIVKLLQ